MEVYSVSDLSFRYPGAKENAIKNISFNISSGEFVLLCGVSGSGKSTLLKCLKTCLRPHGDLTGVVRFSGNDLDSCDYLTQAQKIGFVLSSCDYQTITDTVMHELAFGMENLGIDNYEMKKRIAEISSFLGLDGLLDKPIDSLSGGKRRILSLASVLIMQPDVLIFDEPVAQLDPVGAEEFTQVIYKVNREFGTTVIVCEHELDSFFSIADRVLVMSQGAIISDASPDETIRIIKEKHSDLVGLLPLPARVFVRSGIDISSIPADIPHARQVLLSLDRDFVIVPDRSLFSDKKPFVKAENIFFSYGKNKDDVLRGIRLEAYPGEILSVVGGNGSGKTTLLHCIASIKKPFSGRVMIGDSVSSKKNTVKVALMPQDPTTLFVKDNLHDDLYEVLDDSISEADKEELICRCADLCSLGHLLQRHPFDLSGGERQRAALAKLLLTDPDLILLDEPVKGLDRPSKQQTGKLLRRIVGSGICVIMVTHDMDFAAEYSDRCTLLFNGECCKCLPSKDFFLGSTFYTTCGRRMTRNIIDGCVTENDILVALGSSQTDDDSDSGSSYELFSGIPSGKKGKTEFSGKKHLSVRSCVAGVSFLLLIVLACIGAWLFGAGNESAALIVSASDILFGFLLIVVYSMINGDRIIISTMNNSRRLLILSLIMTLIVVPLTIAAGIILFDDTKYIFISLLIMAECMIPFFAVFERRVIRTREFVIIAVMCSLCVIGRAVFYMLPEFKPVTAIVIISGAALGAQSGFLVGSVGMLASNMIFGQGPWTPWQMFAMGIIGFIAGILTNNLHCGKSRMSLAVFGFLVSVLLYGGIMDPASILMSHLPLTKASVIACYLAGLPLDLVHGVSTALFLYFGAVPVIKKLERIKLKYGLIE